MGVRGRPGHKVVTGMRRSGKSELMKAFSASVARRDPSSNNVYIDLLDLDNEPLLEYHALHREIIERHKGGRPQPSLHRRGAAVRGFREGN